MGRREGTSVCCLVGCCVGSEVEAAKTGTEAEFIEDQSEAGILRPATLREIEEVEVEVTTGSFHVSASLQANRENK